MAKLILETPHLSQVYIENDEQKCVYVFNEEPFFAHVEDGNLIVGGRIEEHVLIEISNVNLYAEVDLAPIDISNKTVSQLFDVDYLEFIIDETDIKADRIKFRQLIPFGTLELSEIEYNGVIYKGIRNSSLNRQKQPKQD